MLTVIPCITLFPFYNPSFPRTLSLLFCSLLVVLLRQPAFPQHHLHSPTDDPGHGQHDGSLDPVVAPDALDPVLLGADSARPAQLQDARLDHAVDLVRADLAAEREVRHRVRRRDHLAHDVHEVAGREARVVVRGRRAGGRGRER